MIVDRYCGQHTSSSTGAAQAFEDAVLAVAAHRPIGDALDRALAADPDFVAAHALKGLGGVMLAKAETVAGAQQTLALVETNLHKLNGGTASERMLAGALAHAAAGRLADAASRIEGYLVDHPRDLLATKVAHSLRFMSGQSEQMLATTARVLPHWTPETPGYGFVLGCHAFGLEERGHFVEAEATGRSAVRHEPTDAWGLHAVSHVMEMSGRSAEGVAWLEASRSLWPRCNNFGFHLGWHLALFRLEQGDHAAVLDIYDHDIRPTATDDFRDMANAVSMLCRLEQDGAAVGRRWEDLRQIAERRRTDSTYVFASLHYLLALVGSGNLVAARDLVTQLRAKIAGRDDGIEKVSDHVGLQISTAILAKAEGRRPDMQGLAHAASLLPSIGGSHAQRDVFLRTLMCMAADHGDSITTHAIGRIRRQQRSEDRFFRLIETRLGHANSRTAAPLSKLASH